MNITFLSDLRNITKEHYPKQRKQIIELVLEKKITQKPRAYKNN